MDKLRYKFADVIAHRSFSVAYKIWLLFGGANFITIASTNICNEFMNPEAELFDKKRFLKCDSSELPVSKLANFLGNFIFGGIMLISTFACCSLKGGIYSIGGPIGTYRILLAIHNRHITGDICWTDPVFKFGSYFKRDRNYYITKPFGLASWLPLTKE